jgi:zinc protease
LNLENVQGAAEKVMHPQKLTWLIVGDREKIEDEVRKMNLGTVVIMDSDGNVIE